MISQIFTPDCFKVLSLFSISPGSRFNRTEIKNRTRLNNVPLDKALLLLLSSGTITRTKNYYGLNFENDNIKPLLELCSKQYKQLRELPLNVYYLLLDLTAGLSLVKKVEVFLFGSYAKLVYKANSDVDIAVLCSSQLGKAAISKLTAKLEQQYQLKLKVHYFEKKSFYKTKKKPLIKSILKDGVKLI
ncbi:nucleotidyltransferase domain-containing protein [Candidatus Woesearchaeota archaeon]|nr:nucleotidyltransferase domain-containing protein [Candidatus Woesearchaeota archaeon]